MHSCWDAIKSDQDHADTTKSTSVALNAVKPPIFQWSVNRIWSTIRVEKNYKEP